MTPPPFYNGQGRTPHDVRSDGLACFFFILAGLAMIAALVIRSYYQ